jgi:hypothetical protein
MYKLRIYKLSGLDKGNLDYEEFFDTKEQMVKRYDELFKKDLYSLNPTAWELVDGEWKRLEGY